jgi:hypothetical protein
MTTVQRYDVAPLQRAVRTPEGYLLAEGYAGRAGVLVYRNADGTVRSELIPPEELFHPDSLATLGRKPVTLQHPTKDGKPVMVDATNVQTFGVGDVDGELVEERMGGFVKVRVAIRRADAVASVESGQARGLSQGYTCDLDETPGTWRGQPYSAVQRHRVYNHLALCGLGRAGAEARLRIDGADIEIDGPQWPGTETGGRTMDRTASIEIGGVRYDGLDPALASAVSGTITEAKKEAEAARADAVTHKAQLDAVKKQMDECKAQYDAQMADLRKKHDGLAEVLKEKEKKQAELEANQRGDVADAAFKVRFDARLRLLGIAGKLGVEKADEQADLALRKAIVAKHDPAMKLDTASEAYLEAYVDALGPLFARADASQAGAAAAAASLGADGKPKVPVTAEAAHADALAEYKKNTFGV